MDTKLLRLFHGNLYSEGPWDSHNYPCCRLCKTKNTSPRNKHWARGLCKSCYRRLSLTHKLYIDSWSNSRSKGERRGSGKKIYKDIKQDLKINDTQVDNLLEKYNFCCAYCNKKLQNYSHIELDAFQIEYLIIEEGLIIVPICRKCNCSKKGLTSETDLQRWARLHGISYPFNFK